MLLKNSTFLSSGLSLSRNRTFLFFFLHLCLKLSSKHVDGEAAAEGRPLPLQPVFEGERRHHVHGVQLKGRLSEDLVWSQKDSHSAVKALAPPTASISVSKYSLGSGFPVLNWFDAMNLTGENTLS